MLNILAIVTRTLRSSVKPFPRYCDHCPSKSNVCTTILLGYILLLMAFLHNGGILSQLFTSRVIVPFLKGRGSPGGKFTLVPDS